MICILAVDPGVTGALAFYFPDEGRVSVYDAPVVNGDINPHILWQLLDTYKPTLAVIEQVSPMPGEGVSSVWRFAAAYTAVRITVTLYGVPMLLVRPSIWKKHMLLPGGKEGKEKSRSLAIQTFPAQASLFARKKDHNRAEAALLAIYASQKLIHRNPSP